jgi:tetratricopeptide (TPR) repeat protein
MRLLMQFINRSVRDINIQKRMGLHSLLFVSLLILQGCSSLFEGDKKTQEDISTLGKNIVDMVDVPTEKAKRDSSVIQGNAPELISQNVYLEREKQILASLPKVITVKYSNALKLMQKQQWNEAGQLLNQVLISQPKLSGAYVNKALIALHQNSLQQASINLNRALAINDKNPYAHQIKGQIARRNGQFEQAKKHYLQALTIWPEYPEAQLNLAILLELYQGRLLDARKYYVRYLATHEDDKQVQRWLAGVDIKIKRAGLTVPQISDNDVTQSSTNKAEEG